MAVNATQPAPSADRGQRLESWKDIAAYLQRDIKTVQRWERERGLPVHRTFGESRRPAVHAYTAEIERWRSEQSGGPAKAAEPAAVSRPRRSARWLVPAVAAAAATVALFAIGGWRRSRVQTPNLIAKPFTYYPGHEEFPAISPDGRQIAFIWDGESPEGTGDLYVQLVGGADPLRLTETPEAETSPAWSPDGTQIAFLRPAEDGQQAIVIPALGGVETVVAHTRRTEDAGLAWAPDGKSLALPAEDVPTYAIHSRSLADQTTQPLTSPPVDARITRDAYPAFSPDGTKLAVARISAGLRSAVVLPVDGGEETALPTNATDGYTWAADGRSLVFSAAKTHAGALQRISLSDGRVEPLTVGDDALNPTIRGDKLAYTHWLRSSSIRVQPLRSSTLTKSAPDKTLIQSTRREHSPAVSPDGSQIAFVSDRTGSHEIWLADADGGGARQLTHLNGRGTGSPKWSPDGRSIVFDSSVLTPGNSELYVIGVEGGEPRRLTNHPAQDRVPSFSRDGRWIYFGSSRGGMGRHVWKIPAGGGAAEQVVLERSLEAVEGADRKLYYSLGTRVPGLGVLDLASGEVSRPEALADAGYRRYWALSDRALFFVAGHRSTSPDGPFEVQRYDLASGEVRPAAKLPHALLLGPAGLAVAPDERFLLSVSLDRDDKDVMLVEGFH